MDIKELYLCSGCKTHFPAQGGYFVNADISKTGTLTLVQVKADSGFSPKGFKYFTCGRPCSSLLYNEMMDKTVEAPATAAPAGETSENINPLWLTSGIEKVAA